MKNVMKILVAVLVVAAMAVAVYADNFVPSITEKPTTAPVVEEDGTVGDVIDADGNVIGRADEGDLVVVNYADRETAAPEIREQLERAYEAMMKIKSLEEIDPSLKGMVVTDIFYVGVSGALKEMVEKGYYFAVKFDVDMDLDDVVGALYFGDEGWEKAEEDSFLITNDGEGVQSFFRVSGVYAWYVAQVD